MQQKNWAFWSHDTHVLTKLKYAYSMWNKKNSLVKFCFSKAISICKTIEKFINLHVTVRYVKKKKLDVVKLIQKTITTILVYFFKFIF